MSSSPSTPSTSDLPSSTTTAWNGWYVVSLDSTESTNESARDLPAWTVVVADQQSRGRGRHGRRWESSRGGLWCSAVLPTPGEPDHWKALPLMVGLAVHRSLAAWHVVTRLRWPNDIMIGSQKLAGLLLERYHPDRVVAGIGINITNHPVDDDPALQGIATRLADHTPAPPSRDALMCRLLDDLRPLHQQVARQGIASLTTDLNRLWGPLPRRVSIDNPHGRIIGDFLGVTVDGDLIVQCRDGKKETFTAASVSLLRELATE